MNYFLSDIHGASNAYFEMKDRIGLKNNDELYIIGDILDGNTKNPSACLDILEDIMAHDNIHLILGDHEYAHIMRYATQDTEETYEWASFLCSEQFGGEPLLRHFTEKLSAKEQNRYASFLISCEMSAFIKIGHRYFYLVHASPVACKNDDVCKWQKEISETPIDLNKNYLMAIASDPGLDIPQLYEKYQSVFILAGHTPTKHFFDTNPQLMHKYYGEGNEELPSSPEKAKKHQRIILENHKMLINCGCSEDALQEGVKDGWAPDLACVAIDAAGFFTEYLLQ